MSGGEWNFSHLPTAALYDDRLKDSERIVLAKIIDLGWDNRPGDPETPPFHWKELAAIFGIKKTVYFEAIKILKVAGYIELKKRSDSKIIITAIPPFRNCGPSSSLKDSIKYLREEGLKRSSGIPEIRNEIFKELREAGIGEPLRSELSLDQEIDLEYVRVHRRYAKLRGDPARFLANRLLNREPVPSPGELARLDPDSEEARARYDKGWED